MRNLNVHLEGQPMTIDTQRVDCHLLADGKVALEARILLRQSSQIKEVSL